MTIVGEEWLEALTKFVGRRGRSRDTAEFLSDASNELYLNALTARCLREYGQRSRSIPRFWVRAEWSKTDISYGALTSACRALTSPRQWNLARKMRETGDIGHIEAKVVWGHSGSKHSGTIETLARQLERRRDADIQSKRTGQQYHGLVWAYAHSTTKNGGTQAWEELPALEANLVSCAKKWNLKPLPRRRGNADEGYFREVFVQRLRIWPSLPNYNGRLSLGIFKLT